MKGGAASGDSLANAQVPVAVVKSVEFLKGVKPQLLNVVLVLVGMCAALFLLRAFQNSLVPLVFAVILVSCLEPLVEMIDWPLLKLLNCSKRQWKRCLRRNSNLSQPMMEHRVSSRAETSVSPCHTCSALLAIVLSLALLVGGITALVACHSPQTIEDYKGGFLEIQDSFQLLLGDSENLGPLKVWGDMYRNASADIFDEVEKSVEEAAETQGGDLFGSVFTGLYWIMMVCLYAFFWLLEPVHDDRVELVFSIVRRYFWWKSLVNFFICTLIFAWLSFFVLLTGVDVALISFFLLFIPVVGDFVPFLLPFPLVFFDAKVGASENFITGNLPYPSFVVESEPLLKVARRLVSTIVCLLGMGVISTIRQFVEPPILAYANKPHEKSGKSRMFAFSKHPVTLLFMVNFCSDVWGPIGMLISVPVLWLSVQLMDQKESTIDSGDSAKDLDLIMEKVEQTFQGDV